MKTRAATEGPTESPRVVRQGSFLLPCSTTAAIAMFTSEGERHWVAGWQPEYLSGANDEVGAVWRTTHGEDTTTWITTDRDDDRVRYARISGNGTAGLVEVRCSPDSGGTRAWVTYDLTAYTNAGFDALQQFAAGFDDMLEHWRQATTSVLAAAPSTEGAEDGPAHDG